MPQTYCYEVESHCLVKPTFNFVYFPPPATTATTTTMAHDNSKKEMAAIGQRTILYWCFAPALAMQELANLHVHSILVMVMPEEKACFLLQQCQWGFNTYSICIAIHLALKRPADTRLFHGHQYNNGMWVSNGPKALCIVIRLTQHFPFLAYTSFRDWFLDFKNKQREMICG